MMTSLLGYVFNAYNSTMELRDHRTDNWFMVDSPWPMVTILTFYLYFCISLGPRLMADKKPMEFRRFTVVYNLIMVIWCAALFVGALRSGWWRKYNYRCQPNNYSSDPSTLGTTFCVYYGYFMKLYELMDTVFIVLRKNFKRVSFLHVYHHGSIPVVFWLYLRFTPGADHATFVGLVNCFVNSIVYSYFILALIAPKSLNYRWLKPYLTMLQISQFVIGLIHLGQLLFIECDVPNGIVICMGFNIVVFLVLFIKFYIDTYMKKKDRPEVCDATKLTKKFD